MKQLLLIALLLNCWSLSAQQITTEITWEKSYGGTDDDIALKSRKTSDGGQIIVGHTKSDDGDFANNQGQMDAFILKLDVEGNVSWRKTLGGPSYEQFSDVQQTADGGYIVVGETRSNLHNNSSIDGWLVRLDAAGDIVWSNVIGGSYTENFASVALTADGEYLVVGFAYSTNGDFANIPDKQQGFPFGLMLFDQDGKLKTWYPLPNWCKQVLLTDDNTAWTLGLNHLFRIDLSTKVVRDIDLTYLGTRLSLTTLEKAESGHLLLGGFEYREAQLSTSPKDAVLLKADPTGSVIWKKTWASNLENVITSMCLMPNGDYLIGGHTNSTNNTVQTKYGYQDCWIFVTNTSGEVKHQAFYGSYSNDLIYDVQAASDSSFLFVGRAMIGSDDVSQHKGKSDIWLVKLKANFIRQAPDKEILVYPNPIFNRQFTLEINPEFIGASFSIYNNLGQVIQTGTIYSSINFLQLANAQTDGMYTLAVQQDKAILTQKLLLHR